MAYTDFVDGKPVATDGGLLTIDYMRENLMAMRDAVVMGMMTGWSYAPTVGTGSASQPQYYVWSKGTERLRATPTWGTSGGADGNPTQIVWEYSSDSGSTWDAIETVSITYDAGGNVTARGPA
jgi:hypothetical protein